MANGFVSVKLGFLNPPPQNQPLTDCIIAVLIRHCRSWRQRCWMGRSCRDHQQPLRLTQCCDRRAWKTGTLRHGILWWPHARYTPWRLIITHTHIRQPLKSTQCYDKRSWKIG